MREVAAETLARFELDGYALEGQLSLEHHGAITMPGLMTRIAQRVLCRANSAINASSVSDSASRRLQWPSPCHFAPI